MNGCQRIAIEARFLGYIERLSNGCMIWTGAQSQGGRGRENRPARGGPYGSFWINSEYGAKRAHIVWAWLSGLIERPAVPEGKHLDHVCESGPLCVSCLEVRSARRNLQLSRTRDPKKDPAQRAKAIQRAEAARIARLSQRRQERVSG